MNSLCSLTWLWNPCAQLLVLQKCSHSVFVSTGSSLGLVLKKKIFLISSFKFHCYNRVSVKHVKGGRTYVIYHLGKDVVPIGEKTQWPGQLFIWCEHRTHTQSKVPVVLYATMAHLLDELSLNVSRAYSNNPVVEDKVFKHVSLWETFHHPIRTVSFLKVADSIV